MPDRNELTPSSSPAAATAPSETRPVAPAVDIFEDASGITLLADMPGVSRDSLDIRLDGDTLAG